MEVLYTSEVGLRVKPTAGGSGLDPDAGVELLMQPAAAKRHIRRRAHQISSNIHL